MPGSEVTKLWGEGNQLSSEVRRQLQLVACFHQLPCVLLKLVKAVLG